MFTSNVKRLMEEKKKTFQDVVSDSGLSRQTIHKARQDEGIAESRLSTIGRIAHALEVPVKDLFDGEYEEPHHDK
ncbi:helix-turn-helix transcriptional regulator [Desulfovibrio sp. OttesenSCG-928-G15]|nr:helix-turn-helix transcriptional regulator [Desulfovibrio sp. OttesenSCG-928-G15]